MSLHEAVRGGDSSQVMELLSGDCDINTMDDKHRTALHLAAWKGDAVIVEILLNHKADPLLEAMDAFTALHFAVQIGNIRCCELLLNADKSLLEKQITKGGKTPLHLAIGKCHVNVVKLLLDAGANIHMKTKGGMNARMLAASCQHSKEDIVELLTSKSAMPHVSLEKSRMEVFKLDKSLKTSSNKKRGDDEEDKSQPSAAVLPNKRKKTKLNEELFLSHLDELDS
jgi:ankyrin repeat protein